jgi:hypothetical protein
MILLRHDTCTDGMIATSAAPIDGTPYPARYYQHNGHFVVLEGPAHVIAHDAEEICKIAGYRLATPAESDAYHRARRGETALTEEATSTDTSASDSVPEKDNGPAPESDSDSAPTSQVLTTETAPDSRPRARRKG